MQIDDAGAVPTGSTVEGPEISGNEVRVKTLAAPIAASFADEESAGDCVAELLGLGAAPRALLAGRRDVRRQRAFAQRFGIAELPHPDAERSGLAVAFDRLTAHDGAPGGASFAEPLVAAGIASDTAAALDRDLDDGVLLVVPASAPAAALGVVLRHHGALGDGVLHYVVPLRREELQLERRAVTEHEVTVRTEIVSETRTLEVPLEREELVIERRRAAVDGTLGEPEEIRIPLTHEELLLTKRTVVTAEVDVRRERHVEVTQVSETLRREELRVEADPGVRIVGGD